MIREKIRPILWGRFPFEEQWRSALSSLILLLLLCVSAWPAFWRRSLALAWLVAWGAVIVLMGGGLWGLTEVPTHRWGGVTLTLILATLALISALPLGVLLALGRRSRWPLIRTLCATYIEVIRGVPLISVLFMATFMLPLLFPQSWRPDVLLRVLIGLVMFVAAYVAEVIRGGLQSDLALHRGGALMCWAGRSCPPSTSREGLSSTTSVHCLKWGCCDYAQHDKARRMLRLRAA